MGSIFKQMNMFFKVSAFHKGNISENITKFCHKSGRWAGKTDDDFTRSHGWTNFTMCFTQEVIDIMRKNNGSLVVSFLILLWVYLINRSRLVCTRYSQISEDSGVYWSWTITHFSSTFNFDFFMF